MSGRFEYLPEKVAPCGLHARRNHGTKTGPDNEHTIGGAGGVGESCRGMFATVAASFANLLFGKLMSSFLNGLSSVTSNLLQEGTVHRFHAL